MIWGYDYGLLTGRRRAASAIAFWKLFNAGVEAYDMRKKYRSSVTGCGGQERKVRQMGVGSKEEADPSRSHMKYGKMLSYIKIGGYPNCFTRSALIARLKLR